jgi:ferredoxin
VRIVIDADVCTGHGRCYTLAPEVFAANDDDGHGELIGDGTVPEALEAAAKRAALNCPERAITVFDD